jgi:two-component system sensor kinase FixL
VLSSKIPLRDADGKIAGLVGIGRDITERRQAEELLRESEAKLRDFSERLERSNRELQDFAYVASHDLQEPLRKIIVFGERLKQKNADQFDPDSLNYLDRMQQAGTRMQNLINDLLAYSRVTSKAQAFAKVDLAQVASGVVDDLEGRIEIVHGRVEVGPLPVIEAEPLQMRQLLQNLIGNALKFRRPDVSPCVKVEARIIDHATAPDTKLCQLTVTDNGIGFEEKHAERIFELFQRLHARHEYEGTGMGLAIVRKIAVHHGGEVVARGKPGEGATFIVTLPMAHAQNPPVKTATEAKVA